MVAAECKNRSDRANQISEQNIKAVMLEVGVASRRNLDRCKERDDGEDKEIYRRAAASLRAAIFASLCPGLSWSPILCISDVLFSAWDGNAENRDLSCL